MGEVEIYGYEACGSWLVVVVMIEYEYVVPMEECNSLRGISQSTTTLSLNVAPNAFPFALLVAAVMSTANLLDDDALDLYFLCLVGLA